MKLSVIAIFCVVLMLSLQQSDGHRMEIEPDMSGRARAMQRGERVMQRGMQMRANMDGTGRGRRHAAAVIREVRHVAQEETNIGGAPKMEMDQIHVRYRRGLNGNDQLE